MPHPATLSILLIGNTDRAEFAEARAALAASGELTCVREMGTAEESLLAGLDPELIVFAQAYPGEFSHDEVDRLRRRAPLARLAGLLGSWCEGEMRTGKPWPGVPRVYWHQWPSRGQRQVRQLRQGRPSAWTTPITATEEERLLADARRTSERRQGLAAVATRRAEMHDWLAEACRSRGLATAWLWPPRPTRIGGATLGIFDGGDLRHGEEEQLRQMAAMLRPAGVIALLDFPRLEDTHRALAAGAAAVLAKPVFLDDLAWEMDRLMAQPTATGQ